MHFGEGLSRRNLVRTVGAAAAGLAFPGWAAAQTSDAQPPVRPITRGPRQHWFGYYDKQQVDRSGRYALAMEVDPIFRSPTPSDTLAIGLIDLTTNAWRQIGTSGAWGWQQGCMLQWVPGHDRLVMWNDRQDGRFVARLYDLDSGKTRTLPRPIYTLSPDGGFGLSIDFARLQRMRPGYGYAAPWRDEWPKAPDDAGIWRTDLVTGESRLILTYAQMATIARPLGSVADNWHWFNHLLIAPDGKRFIFLNRSRKALLRPGEENDPAYRALPEKQQFTTRAMTANVDGSELYVLNDTGRFSHFIWKGSDVITAWCEVEGSPIEGFYELPDKSRTFRLIDHDAMPVNGHNTYVPHTNNEWILNDSYPDPVDQKQVLYLYHVPTKRKVVLGRFEEPQTFYGEWRCDLHPRCDPAGERVFFDSTHSGGARQVYSVDIARIVGT
jgi:hypothetical protein